MDAQIDDPDLYYPPDYEYCEKYGCELEFEYYHAHTTSRGKGISILTAYCDMCGRLHRFKNFARVIE